MATTKITPYPPQKQSLDSFIAGEETATVSDTFPWEEKNIKNIRADVQKAFTIRLPEEYILKIKYISEKTRISQQQMVREAIKKEADSMLSEIQAQKNK